jgi:hypothetical protein
MLRRLGVKVYNLTPESNGLIGHGMYADVPAVVQEIGQQIGRSRVQDADVQAVLGNRPIDPNVTAQPLLAPQSPAPVGTAAIPPATATAAGAAHATPAAAAPAQATPAAANPAPLPAPVPAQ